ncbi:uncharacterized protein LOC114676301 [Macaca mulatta]
MAPSALPCFHREHGSSQLRERGQHLHAFTRERRNPQPQAQTAQAQAPYATRQEQPQTRPENCRKRGRGGEGKSLKQWTERRKRLRPQREEAAQEWKGRNISHHLSVHRLSLGLMK